MRCAFSNREIDLATTGWLRTPDGKYVLPQFFESYIVKMKEEQREVERAEGEHKRKVEARRVEMASLKIKKAEEAKKLAVAKPVIVEVKLGEGAKTEDAVKSEVEVK